MDFNFRLAQSLKMSAAGKKHFVLTLHNSIQVDDKDVIEGDQRVVKHKKTRDDANRIDRLGFSVPEVAAAFGLSERLIWTLIHTGKLKSVQFGRRVIVTRKHIEAFCREQDSR